MDLNDSIEDEVKRVENLIRGIFAGNIFDLGSAQVHDFFVVELVKIGYPSTWIWWHQTDS